MLSTYVAGPYADQAFIRVVHERLLSHGISPTSVWAEQAKGPEDFSRYSPETLREAAEGNDRDIHRSDVIMIIARDGAGGECFAEVRYALAIGKPVLWVGRKTLSAWREGVLRCEDLDDAISRLVKMTEHYAMGFRGWALARRVAA